MSDLSALIVARVKRGELVGLCLILSGCGEGPVFVWTARDVFGLGLLALVAIGFALFFAWICLLVVIDAIKARFRKWFRPSSTPSDQSPVPQQHRTR